MTDAPRTTPKRGFPLHPLLFAAYPVLFLYAHNAGEFPARAMIAPLVVLITAAVVLWVVLGLILRNTRKAAVLVSLVYILIFFFRLIRETVIHLGGADLPVSPEVTTFIVLGVLFLAVAIPTVRTRRQLRMLTRIINVAAIVLILIPASHIAYLTTEAPRHNLKVPTGVPAWDTAPLPEDTSALPDIYYIICDAYGRDDILREYYGHNNAPFLDWLETQGFTVARKSHSNYNYTGTSLPTSFNMMHLVPLVKYLEASCADVTSMSIAMQHSAVTRFLKRRGYRTVAFSTGYAITDVINADTFLSPTPWRDNELITGLLQMTPFGWAFHKQSFKSLSRSRILFTLDSLKSLPTSGSPKFVYAHIMAPHRPFVFGANGEHVNPTHLYPPGGPLFPGDAERDDYRKFYVGQLRFLNSKLMEVITAIKQRSTTPPIIILQGDHGPCSILPNPRKPTPEGIRERMSILNAYHLPGGGAEKLYPTITPVNSFRVVFNHYFGANLALEEDDSYYEPGGIITKMLRDLDAKKEQEP